MDANGFINQRRALIERVRRLYQAAGEEPERDEVLSRAFEELQVALEELQAVEEELHTKHSEMLSSMDTVESERQRYQELFELAPLSYLVTSLDGTIRQANLAATTVLGREARQLVGRSLALFVPEGERRAFRSQMAELRGASRQEWEIRLQPWQGAPRAVAATVAPTRDRAGRPTALLWLLHDSNQRQQAEERLSSVIGEQERQIGQLTAALATARQSGEASPAPQERAEALRQKFAFLAEASVLLAVALDDEAVLVRVAHLAVPVIADLCILDVLAGDGALSRLAVAYKDPAWEALARKLQGRTPHTLGVPDAAEQDARNGQPYICAALPGAPADKQLRSLSPDSVLVVPLRVRGQALGVLTFVLMDSSRSFGPDDLVLAEELARRAAVALDRARLYRET